VRTKNYDVFKQQYKQYDLLIIDDIQFIKGKDRTMEEFFYLYNHFHNEKKQLILTCDVLPAKIEDMDDRLKSRFSWGLTVELEPPELEMRVAILQKKAEAAGVVLDEQAAFFSEAWKTYSGEALVQYVCRQHSIWGTNLTQVTGLADSIHQELTALQRKGALAVLQNFNPA